MSGMSHLREVTAGSMPEPGQLALPGHLEQAGDRVGANKLMNESTETCSARSCAVEFSVGDPGDDLQARKPADDGVHGQQRLLPGTSTTIDTSPLRSLGQAAVNQSLRTPTKLGATVCTARAGGVVSSWKGCPSQTPPAMTPISPLTSTEKV